MAVTANDVFDVEKFWTDVHDYMTRNKISKFGMSAISEMDSTTLKENLKLKKSLSLRYAVMLSVVCDLSLDQYIKDKSQWHSKY